MRIPSDLADLLGHGEIHRSLKTADHRQARALAQTMRGRADAAFTLIRCQRLLGEAEAMNPEAASLILARHLPLMRQPAGGRESSGRGIKLSQAIEQFVEERAVSWTGKTRLIRSACLRLVLEVIGDKPLRLVGREDCRRFRDILVRLPPNMGKRFPGKNIDEVLALSPAPMSLTNVNKTLIAVASLFNWAKREGIVADNPARGLVYKSNGRADTERDAFTPDDLRHLFASPLYRGPRSDAQAVRDSKWWLPLVALHSGMRLEEIAQLQRGDIREVDGIWCFDVKSGEGRKLKTAHSARLVPLHPELIRLGLLNYRDQLAEGVSGLWPDLKAGADGFLSSSFSKWFGRYKRRIGLANPKLTFHSFRHTFINALKQAGVAETVIKELVGHKDNSITMARYGKRYQPARLLDAIQGLDFGLQGTACP